MNQTLKQSVLELLAEAKTHIEAGETALATEKIDEAIAAVENEGVDTTSEDPEDEENNNPTDPPLPGQGSNGGLT